jgi:hypothetical protein
MDIMHIIMYGTILPDNAVASKKMAGVDDDVPNRMRKK